MRRPRATDTEHVSAGPRPARDTAAPTQLDALTGALDRASIMAALRRELETSTATGVVCVDVERPSADGDAPIDLAGEELLVHVAERLAAAMRAGDELGRIAGEEFLIVLHGAGGRGAAMSEAQRISEVVHGACELSRGALELSASVGVACADGAPLSAEELLRRADAAMCRSRAQHLGIPVLAA